MIAPCPHILVIPTATHASSATAQPLITALSEFQLNNLLKFINSTNMAESLKLINDLKQLSQVIQVSTLSHFFARFDPSTSKNLRETISHFHMRDLEASDYRSAYHQFCDWLYGWNVSDAAEFADLKDVGSIAQYLNQQRVPREILITSEREKSECQRLLKTFETLFSLSRRQLKKFYMEIEDEMPRLGQGLDTLSIKKPKGNDDASVNATGKDAMHNSTILNPGEGMKDGLDEKALQEMDDDEEEKAWGKAKGDGGANDGQGEKPHNQEEEEQVTKETTETEPDFHPDPDEHHGAQESASVQRGSVTVRRRSTNNNAGTGPRGSKTQPGGSTLIKEENEVESAEATSAHGENKDAGSEPPKSDVDHSEKQAQKDADSTGEFTIEEKQVNTEAPSEGGFSFLKQVNISNQVLGQVRDNLDDETKALQRDVNHVMAEIDRVVEYTLVSLSSLLVILTFSEIMEDKDNFAKYSAFAHELSMDFVSNTLKTVWDILNREASQKMSLAILRDPASLKDVIRHILEARAVNGVVPKYRMRKLHFKFTTVHDVLSAFDIHVFPNFVEAHKEGLKCAQSSAFDQNLWLTGGYDCIIRIFDIRASNGHTCLAQYVGHKSIITDVHFTKNDANIVSSSFDRTVKIWNSQTATCDRTLIGHTDAVTCCAVTPDARYIASGSTDCTVRFWDYNTGDIISVIKKHTRWIKCVRFSPDGRMLATAGLDRRVYIWETKILANSRSPSHSRCFDSFGDYVLDMALTRPSLLITTSRDSAIKIFDYMTGHELFSLNLSPSWACTLAVSENGQYFATGSFDNNVIIFRTRDFAKIREIRVFNLGIMCIRFPKDVSYIAVGTSEGFLQQIAL